MFVVNIESAKKQQNNEENIHNRNVSLDYKNSVPHIMSQQGADLVFAPTLKRQKL